MAESTRTADKPAKDDAPFYCPGCGRRGNYQQKCEGKREAPHPPIEMVSTGELQGDPEKLTRAPDTTNLG